MNLNCSTQDLRNLQEQVKKTLILLPKIVLTFHCSNKLFQWSQKNFKFYAFSLEFQKFLSITRTIFSHSRSEQFMFWCFNVLSSWLLLLIKSDINCSFFVSSTDCEFQIPYLFLHTVRRLEKWFFTSWSTEDKIRRSFLMNCHVCGQPVNQWSLHLYSVAKNQKIALQISQISEVTTSTG